MASTKGGSGKSYNVSSNGTITVSRPDGSTKSISPGQSGYAKTNQAMQADTGKSYNNIKNSSSSSSSSGSSGSSGGIGSALKNFANAISNVTNRGSSSSSSSSGSSGSSSSVFNSITNAFSNVIEKVKSTRVVSSYIPGGSGKSYNVNSNGTITIKENGKTRTITKSDSKYESTKKAMEADTGWNIDRIKNVSTNTKNGSTIGATSSIVKYTQYNDLTPGKTEATKSNLFGNPLYGSNIGLTKGYTSSSGTYYPYNGSYSEGNITIPKEAVYDKTNNKYIWKTKEGLIMIHYANDKVTRAIDDGTSEYQHAQSAMAAIKGDSHVTSVAVQEKLSQAQLDLTTEHGISLILDKNGNIQKRYDGPVVDGVLYDENGNIINSGYTGNGVINIDDYTVEYGRNEANVLIAIYKPKIKPEQKKEQLPTPTIINPPSYDPETENPPIIPPFIYFDLPVPTFYSDLKKQNKYSYFFGLDELKIMNNAINPYCCFVSKAITLNNVKTIALEADYFCDDNSSIEFYIIDGTNTIPIIPFNETLIKNEKLFINLPTRFTIDETQPILIKEKSKITSYTLSDYKNNIIDMSKDFNITYTPVCNYYYQPYNNTIKLKIILRNYELEDIAPYIKTVKIRMYGEDNLWNMNI